MIDIASPDLTADETAAIRANLAQLSLKQERAKMRSNFYNGRERLHSFGFSIPPQMRDMDAALGWPAKTCDALSARLHLEGLVLPGSATASSEIEDIFNANRMAIRWPQAQVSTFQHGCSFVAVTPGDVENDEPEVLISVMPATEATGVWDVRSQSLKSALWVAQTDAMYPTTAVLFLRTHTVQLSRERMGPWVVHRVPNPLPRVPVSLLAYRPQLDRPFGMSRITRPVMWLTQMAVRTLLRTEVSAEFYSSPQRYAMGADEESFVDEAGNKVSAWETILGKIWMIPRDEDGLVPEVGQFPQMSMQPHVDQSKWLAAQFAGETDLPVSTLGIVQDNPASAEAIEAAWAAMVGVAELSQVEFGVPAVEIGQNALMLADRSTSLRDLLKLRPRWRSAKTYTKAAMADATVKQIAAGVLRPDSEVALEQLGYDRTDIDRIRAEHEAARLTDPLAGVNALLNPTNAAGNSPVPEG